MSLSHDQGGMCGHDTALVGDDTFAGALDLIAGDAPHLPDAFDDKLHAGHASFRGEPPACVDGKLTAEANAAALDESPAFPLPAKPVVLKRHEDGDRVTVIDLRNVHVPGRQLRHSKGSFRRRL